MRSKLYNKQFPCPMDRYLIDIYKNFRQLSNSVLDIWKSGVVKGMLAERQYVDLHSARLEMRHVNGEAIPIVSLKPVIGREVENTFNNYIRFFDRYVDTRETLLTEIKSSIYLRNNNPKSVAKFSIAEQVNLLKLLSITMKLDVFDPNLFDTEVEYSIDGSIKVTDHFVQAMIRSDSARVVGDGFIATGDLGADVDDVLIGAFYRYLYKQAEVKETLVAQ